MTKHTFTIEYNSILERVLTESGYTALAREASGLPEKQTRMTIVTEDDKNIISSTIPTAVDECLTTISRCLGEASATNDAKNGKCNAFIYIPANYPTAIVTALENIITEIVICRCLQQWYLIVKPDEASLVSARLQPMQVKLREMLSLRSKP